MVSVEAVTAGPISLAPSAAAVIASAPSSRLRAMFSSTTMALSTSMPMASAIPPRLMMFRVMLALCISMKVAITDTGIATETTAVVQALRRNRYSTKIASRPPNRAAPVTPLMAWRMNTDWS